MAKGGNDDTLTMVLLIVLAIFIPPVAVWWVDGCGLHLLINILLCCLFFLPAIIHALWLVLTK